MSESLLGVRRGIGFSGLPVARGFGSPAAHAPESTASECPQLVASACFAEAPVSTAPVVSSAGAWKLRR